MNSVMEHVTIISLMNYTPLPGTKIAESPEKYGCEIVIDDVDKYNLCLWGNEGMNQWESNLRINGILDEILKQNRERMIAFLNNSGKMNKG